MTPATTLIRLEGRDALDLIHRISTQHLRDLTPGECRATSFCDFRGRVQHRAIVACTAPQVAWLVRADAPGAELFAQVDRQLFRDDVRMEDWSDRADITSMRSFDGSAAGTVESRDGVPVRLHVASGIDLVIGDSETGTPLDETTRIRLGHPRHGHEIREDFNALEVGLAHDVHLNKGCFTGQEALLRMMTYSGVRRQLARLEGEGTAPSAGETLRRGDTDAGVVTSVANEGAAWSALAVVRRDALDSGEALAGSHGARVSRATAFPDLRPLGLPEAPAPRT